MKISVTVLIFIFVAGSVHPFSVKNSLSTEVLRRDYEDQSIISGITFEDTLSLKVPELPVLLLTGYYEAINSLQKTGAGAGIVVPYLDYFYSEISYSYFSSAGTPTHRVYCDATYEKDWGYLTLSGRADFSVDKVLLTSIGIKNNLPADFSLWNRYTMAFSTVEELSHAWWTEINYQIQQSIGIKAGLTVEYPVSNIFPSWENFEILAGINLLPDELVGIKYQLALQQQQYAFQQKHTIIMVIKCKQ